MALSRIKGTNSDYIYVAGKGIQEVDPQPEELYLQVFICPYKEPSSIDEHKGDNYCNGTDAKCPHDDQKSGHARLQLHQSQGISLVADKDNKIIIDQKGEIYLSPASGVVHIKPPQSQEELSIIVSNEAIEVQSKAGAKIRFDSQGNIELIPANSKSVKIQGSLQVEGTLQGPAIEKLKATLKQE